MALSTMLFKMLRNFLNIVLPWAFGSLACLNLGFKVIKNGFKILEVKPRPISPAILSSVKYGEHKYMTLKARGIKIHYVEKGDRRKPLLLFLHGFPEFWFCWRHQIEHLSSKYCVVAIDLKGYGDSSKPTQLSEYSHSSIVEDLHQFILTLDRPDCTLIAHDFGAVFAWTLVGRYPELFKRHISLNGPHIGVFMKLIQTNFQQFKMSWYTFFFRAPWIPEKSLQLDDLAFLKKMIRDQKSDKVKEDVVEAYKYTFSKPGSLTPPLNYYRMTFKTSRKEIPMKVTVPTLIIWGDKDLALDVENPKRMAKICDDVQLKFINGAGHFVQVEEWEKVNKLIDDYCDTA